MNSGHRYHDRRLIYCGSLFLRRIRWICRSCKRREEKEEEEEEEEMMAAASVEIADVALVQIINTKYHQSFLSFILRGLK
jgi:hypothetical protein